jgi:hypothetical protein
VATIRDARPVTLLFAAAAALSAALLLGLGARLTFLLDDWEFLIYRPGFTADAILGPHGENIAVGPVLVYKALLELFGMDSALPFRVVSVGAFLVSVSVLFVWLRRRVGEWLALAGAVSVLFLGPAWEDLLWAFQVGYFTSMAAGLGALLVLERRSARGDLIACGLLSISILFSSLGLPFCVAALVMIALGPKGHRAERLFTLVVPAALFAIWWLGWGREADTEITLENVATAPLFLVDGLASALSSLFGLATPRDESPVGALDWGRPLLVAALGLAGWRLWRVRRIDPTLVVLVCLAATFWLLAGFNEKPGRDPLVSRYQYIGVIFVLMIAAQLLNGVRLRRVGLLAVFAITGLAVFSNINFLHQAYKSYLHTSQIERADLAALEIGRDRIDPSFRLSEDVAHTAYVGIEAGPYWAARDAFGTPAYSEAELLGATPAARAAADSVLAAGLELTSAPGATPASGPCESAGPLGSGDLTLANVPPGGASVENIGAVPLKLALRRFGDGFTIGARRVEPGESRTLSIPSDRSSHPWQLLARGDGQLRICPIDDGGAG